MAMIRRFTVLVAGVFALHLAVGGGFALPMSVVDDSGTFVTSAAGAPEAAAGASSLHSEVRRCPDAANCQMPEVPGGCPPASPCPSAVSLPAGVVPLGMATPGIAHVAVGAMGVPHSRLSPPEVPPPRS